MSNSKKKVFVAMSGGVDSSVAALLLKEQGYEVTGVHLRCYNVDGCAEKDAEDARRVAGHLGIPFYVFDFEEDYKRAVVQYMIDGYRKGITPNPDVMCNKEIKFGLFLSRALELGADCIATGHYIRRTCDMKHELRNEKHVSCLLSLVAARDSAKDQSYFLWTLTQEQLKHCLFPIGDYLKSEVREMARKAGLPTAAKKDSQGICFLGKVTLTEFLKQYIPAKRGEVLNTAGEKIGEHDGAHFYTIGQRHLGAGCQVTGIKGRQVTPPVYVAEKDINANTVTVAEGSDNSMLYRKEVELTDVNIINPDIEDRLIRTNKRIAENGIKVLARVRYRQPLAEACIVYHLSSIKLIFDAPQKFVAPGQSAVFYSVENELLGGGVIVSK